MTNTPPAGTTPVSTTTRITVDVPTDKANQFTQTMHDMHMKIEATGEAMTQINSILGQSSGIMNVLSNAINGGKAAYSSITNVVSQFTGELSKTTSGVNKMSLGITAAFGAINSQNLRTEGLNTFSDQLNQVLTGAGDSVDKIGDIAKSLGLDIPKSIMAMGDDAATAMKQFIQDAAQSADFALKTGDVYVKLAAQTGELGNVHLSASGRLEGFNKTVQDQMYQMYQSQKATGDTIEQMQTYYQILKTLPGAQKEMTEAEAEQAGGMSDLTKTVLLAKGTGMDYNTVIQDMHSAIRDYNASIPEAMRFTAQISEISKNYNVELSDVQKSLLGTADALKMFGNEGDGAAAILNEYVGSLKATHLSGAVATDIISNMTRQMGQLTIAQKAFISAQSGRAGGLQGSFQIDNLLRQKDGLQKVFEMTKNQLTKMMGGNLVSTEQAANSPQAAQQMMKQIAILQQGPLGSFARGPQEAERIIEAFKSGKSDNFKDLVSGSKGVEDATKLGTELAKQSNTYLKNISDAVTGARLQGAVGMQNLFQSGITAGTGQDLGDQNLKAVNDLRKGLSQSMSDAATNSAGPYDSQKIMTDFSKTLAMAPTAIKGAAQGLTGALTSESKQKEPTLSNFTAQQNAATASSQIPDFLKPKMSALGNQINTGIQIGNAAAGNANRSQNAAHTPGATMMQGHNVDKNGMGEITVHVEGICIDCGEKMKASTQRAAVSPASK